MRGGGYRATIAWMMRALPSNVPSARRLLPWTFAAVAGVIAPLVAVVWVLTTPAASSPGMVGGSAIAVSLMGCGMIAAATSGRLWVGVGLAMLAGTGVLVLMQTLGMALPAPAAFGIALAIASFSFASRGALFARSGGDKGWLIALAVVSGEAAMLFTAAAAPGAVPLWLLALLPARWASTAIGAALSGASAGAALWELLALGATAAATLLVAGRWPSRWPYLVMFGTWLAASSLVWLRPA